MYLSCLFSSKGDDVEHLLSVCLRAYARISKLDSSAISNPAVVTSSWQDGGVYIGFILRIPPQYHNEFCKNTYPCSINMHLNKYKSYDKLMGNTR